MGPQHTAETIQACLGEISSKLTDAAAIAKGAVVCAESGNPSGGLRIALDIEQLVYETNTLLNAASLMNRINKERESGQVG